MFNIVKEKYCCFTGHRKIKESSIKFILTKLKRELEDLIASGVDTFISGGACGFDTICASMVLTLREQGHGIKLIMALPCEDQDRYWKGKEKALYRDILSEADDIIYVSQKYHAGCMHERNRFMVNNSNHCICYLEKVDSGTAYTVKYAMNKNITVNNLALNTLVTDWEMEQKND